MNYQLDYDRFFPMQLFQFFFGLGILSNAEPEDFVTVDGTDRLSRPLEGGGNGGAGGITDPPPFKMLVEEEVVAVAVVAVVL